MGQYYNKVANVETRWSDIVIAMMLAGIWHEHNKALDIGCAEGEVTRKIAEFCTEVDAFDIERHKILNCPELDNVNFFEADVKKYYPAKHKYDIIFYLGVHHKLLTVDGYKVLKRLYKTDAIVISRASQKYKHDFNVATENERGKRYIKYYIGNAGQGSISISCINK